MVSGIFIFRLILSGSYMKSYAFYLKNPISETLTDVCAIAICCIFLNNFCESLKFPSYIHIEVLLHVMCDFNDFPIMVVE